MAERSFHIDFDFRAKFPDSDQFGSEMRLELVQKLSEALRAQPAVIDNSVRVGSWHDHE